MKTYFIPKLFLFLTITLLVFSCKQPETVIVVDDPTSAITQDSTRQDSVEIATDFQKLVMGEYSSIGSLDPLLANNATEMRAVQLVYEGLVRLNEHGEVVPGIAKNWAISNDSLRYEFHLRPDVFYHNSDVFSTGTGRRLTSVDVKFVFEQMAKAGVPPRAAHLFMNIHGFDSYFQEQHFVYNPKFRQLKSITGIQTPNDTTVVFELVKKDSLFLKKLATPLAVIYPKEAVNDSDDSFTAVGTGPFVFSQKTADSTYIFSKFDNYYAADEIKLDRIDMVINPSEMELFKALSIDKIQLLPQLGPQIMSEIFIESGQLLPSYEEQYELRRPGGTTEYVLRYNPHSNLPESTAIKIAEFIKTDTGSYFWQMPANLLMTESYTDSSLSFSKTNAETQQIFTVFSADPFIRTFLGNLSKKLTPYEITLRMMNIRAPSKSTGLLFTHDFPLIPDAQWDDYKKLFSFEVGHVALQQSVIEGLSFNQYPWWIEMRGVSVRENDNLN